MEEVSARRRFSRKPRVLVGTFAGTIASYLFFFHHYTHEQDDDGARARVRAVHSCTHGRAATHTIARTLPACTQKR